MAPAGAAPRTDRLPPAPRERRPALAALAVLLIVGGAAVAGLLALRMDTRVQVLVAAGDIAAGEQIEESDLTSTPVGADGVALVPADQAAEIVGSYARVSIAAGQLIDTSMLGATGALQPGTVAVGAALDVGRMPASGLQPGDVVQLVQVRDGEGTVVVPDARVSSSYSAGADGTGGGATVTFIVDVADGPRVAAVAADGSLSVVLVDRGTPLGEEG